MYYLFLKNIEKKLSDKVKMEWRQLVSFVLCTQ